MDQEQINWEPIISSNSHLKGTTTPEYTAPSFKEVFIGDLVKLKTFNKQNNYVINVLDEPNITRVERPEKIPLIIKVGMEYEGIVLEKFSFFNEIKGYNEEILKILIGINDEQYFIFVNSSSCWYGGLIIYKFNGLF